MPEREPIDDEERSEKGCATMAGAEITFLLPHLARSRCDKCFTFQWLAIDVGKRELSLLLDILHVACPVLHTQKVVALLTQTRHYSGSVGTPGSQSSALELIQPAPCTVTESDTRRWVTFIG